MHILATSREPLRAEGEWVVRLSSLTVPSGSAPLTAAEALGYSAIELFTERVAATIDGFVLSDAEVPAVLEICRRLDGVPLALELAAAQVAVFGTKGLAALLDDRLAVLTRGWRTALPRHQTLRAAIDWSYDLLPAIEQIVFRRLGVFRGSFTLEAAVGVAVGERITAADVIEASRIWPGSRSLQQMSAAISRIIGFSKRRAPTHCKSSRRAASVPHTRAAMRDNASLRWR